MNKLFRRKAIIGMTLCVILGLMVIFVMNTINNNERERGTKSEKDRDE